ncbi:MAG: DNA-binding transcriptional regulator [Verrucomicrobiota bacterium]
MSASTSSIVGIRTATWAGFTHDIFRGVLQFMRLHEPWLIQTPLDSTDELEPVRINRFWKGDGLIAFRLTKAEIRAFRRRGTALVSISGESFREGIPVVVPDFEESGRLVARHFLGLGLRHFAYWGDQSRRYSLARGRGFVEVLEASGHECFQIGTEFGQLGAKEERWKNLRRRMLPQLETLPHPIGIFAKDDIAAATLINACQHLGYRVPDDVAIAGPNNDEIFCYTTSPPLTAVRYPGEAIGYRAAEVLHRLMIEKKTDVPGETLIPVDGLAERESTDVLHIADPVVAEAVRRIRRDAGCYPLQVNELVADCQLSRAAFKRRFVLATGHPPKVEIKRVRLANLKDLLLRTAWPVKKVAEHMRFESVEDLGRFMRRETGQTATAYRSELKLEV